MIRKVKKYITVTMMVSILSAGGICPAQDFKMEADAHYQKGLILYHQGKYDQAQEEFSQAKELLKKNEAEKPAVLEKKTEVIKKQTKVIELKAEDKKEDTVPKKKPVIEYTIGAGDELVVSVWENADLDRETIVRPDGKISFALIGDMKAAGLTIEQFKNNLTEALQEYIRYPQVSVYIKKMGGEKVIVLGEVHDPGVYEVTGRRTILEAIGMAGGFTKEAVLKSVILVKGGVDQPVPKKLNLTRALYKGESIENVVLESEDIVYVPSKVISDVSYFLKTILDPITSSIYINKEVRTWGE
ncbi:MAG: polysaccharide biosynthesis/export family protein [Candidatus Omnitrophota bacterium]